MMKTIILRVIFNMIIIKICHSTHINDDDLNFNDSSNKNNSHTVIK